MVGSQALNLNRLGSNPSFRTRKDMMKRTVELTVEYDPDILDGVDLVYTLEDLDGVYNVLSDGVIGNIHDSES